MTQIQMSKVDTNIFSTVKNIFSKDVDTLPIKLKPSQILLKTLCLETPLGSMMAVADEEALYLLEFTTQEQRLEKALEKLRSKTQSTIISGTSAPLTSIEAELKAYFAGKLHDFKTPIHLFGSPFQKRVWAELRAIPYGETRSYAAQANAIGKVTAYRAVANANGANRLAIVVPCHRVINSNGNLGGYGSGIDRKKWLLEHEKTFRND